MKTILRIAFLISATASPTDAAPWKMQPGPLATRWSRDVHPDRVLPEYPRPQMVRNEWLNLNGLWSYAIRLKDADKPTRFDGQILVPFPAESALSGVMKPVGQSQRLWYQRTFEVPKPWSGRRVLLNFGAVDWESAIWLNGRKIGAHCGGYDSFSFDITDALRPSGQQELCVSVWDPTDSGYQPRGKQVRSPEGIWYTSTTGIWQTVWLEPVSAEHIDGLRITPDLDRSTVTISIDATRLPKQCDLHAIAMDHAATISESHGHNRVELKIPNARHWSPDTPTLYDLKLSLTAADGRKLDEVSSYFAMRKISVGPDAKGITRLLLNNHPLFQFGPLDQGFWPDGLYTAPTDSALKFDIEQTKALGFNVIRKHVKVEPQRWYYWCDMLGILVWQDMPSGDMGAPRGREDLARSADSIKDYETELTAMIATHYNSPSIVMWVPFNEGWGQFDTRRIVDLVHRLDTTRLVDNASGWTDRGAGDVRDIHDYPGPGSPAPEPKRAAVLGEFGGLGLPLKGHTWQMEKNWGYRSFTSRDELTDAYLALTRQLRLLTAEPGLSAAVYTQTTDVEIECNGLMPYDRAFIKMDTHRVAAANRALYAAPPTITTILATSERAPQHWRYSNDKPAADWTQPQFDDSKWSHGPGGFGARGTPGIVIGTRWTSSDIWLRTSFDAASDAAAPLLRLFHDEDCEIYLNGTRIAALTGYVTNYGYIAISERNVLKRGRNILAVHCHQTTGGQGIDAGIVDVQDHEAK